MMNPFHLVTLQHVLTMPGRPRRDVTAPEEVNRYVLPIHERQHVGLTTYDAKAPDSLPRDWMAFPVAVTIFCPTLMR